MKLHWKIDNKDQLKEIDVILKQIRDKFYMHSLKVRPNQNGSYDVYLQPKK